MMKYLNSTEWSDLRKDTCTFTNDTASLDNANANETFIANGIHVKRLHFFNTAYNGSVFVWGVTPIDRTVNRTALFYIFKIKPLKMKPT